MQFIQYILSHPQLLIALLVIVGPVLSAIGKKLKEQSDARNREIARERARIEALRTGARIDEGPSPVSVARAPAPSRAPRNARATLEELAAKRRAELTGQAPSRPTATAEGDTIVAMPQSMPGSTGTSVRSQQDAARNEQRQRDQQVREQQQQQQQREQRRRDQQQAAAKKAQSDRELGARTGSMRQEQVRREPAPAVRRAEPAAMSNAEGPATLMDRGQFRRDEAAAAASVAAAAAQVRKSRSEWRRAIVMQELLSQPVSVRRPQE